jgi:hypothetical protein
MAKQVTSVASRTCCLDRHGFGQCLGAVEVEAREKSIEARGDDRSSRVTKPDIRQQLWP